ncbi:hypothetical protein K438DRAFT_1986230 [Mycena galopus ATCC 62051]|nr:hypothetical protein K438DRAFT_1986230 [Mycena galopus ATCC 62051]
MENPPPSRRRRRAPGRCDPFSCYDAASPARPLRVINVGLTLGKGSLVPAWLDNKEHAGLAARLLANPHITRWPPLPASLCIVGAPAIRSTWKTTGSCIAAFPTSKGRSSSPSSPAPHLISEMSAHTDTATFATFLLDGAQFNLWDAKKGGHLILWDVKAVVEFPSGALILLPSATIAHSNVPVARGRNIFLSPNSLPATSSTTWITVSEPRPSSQLKIQLSTTA